MPEKKYPSSNAAVSGASEPWVALFSIERPNSLRSVPASAFGGIRRAHQRAPLLDGVGRFEGEDDGRPRRHELRQAGEKGALAVDRVKPLGFLPAKD